MPVYNAEKYLARCLDSLVCQTLHNIEILCVNDGSTDNSGAILNKYAKNDSRITVFNQENQGPGSARNTALDNTKGKYILFCDADDVLDTNAAHECLVIMENNHVDIVIFNTDIIEIDRIEPGKKNLSGEYISIVQPKNEGMLNQKESFEISILANLWGYCFRSDLINCYNLRFTHYHAGEDGIFLHSYLMLIQSGYALNKKLYIYYVHKGSLADAALDKHPWLSRFAHLPRLLLNTFKFAVKSKKPFKEIYVFYWLFVWLRSRKRKV
ncbi:MAG: glycosyltransferase family 2 protein [Spirochaetaceae bacterium]|nr:glycosyltransferase family 2 protein [Spirochaetaceae bacterium]